MMAAHFIFPAAQPVGGHSGSQVLFGANDPIMYVLFGVPGSGHDTSVKTGI
jgi:hypothetical protein